jgi:hypothetical protein
MKQAWRAPQVISKKIPIIQYSDHFQVTLSQNVQWVRCGRILILKGP